MIDTKAATPADPPLAGTPASIDTGPETSSLVSFQVLLDAIPDASAVLDDSGQIVAVNRAWRDFTQDNGGNSAVTGVGASYLATCERAVARNCADAAEVLVGLREVLAGTAVDSVLDYPCPSPQVGRWFRLRMTPLVGPTRGALVTHVNITRQRRSEQELQRIASLDSLTGLANRLSFEHRLNAALGPGRGKGPRDDVGLLFLDLDGFKPVNDTYGHAAGDEVLQTVSARLTASVRPRDIVARIGGDEFTVMAVGITADGLAALATRIDDLLAEAHIVHGQPVSVGASIGYCMALPTETPAHALDRADKAMYAAKQARTGQPLAGAASGRPGPGRPARGG